MNFQNYKIVLAASFRVRCTLSNFFFNNREKFCFTLFAPIERKISIFKKIMSENAHISSSSSSNKSNKHKEEEEDVEEISEVEKQRHEYFKSLRDSQEREANRRVTKFDLFLVFTVSLILKRILDSFAISTKKALGKLTLAFIALGIYRGRSPIKMLPLNAGDFPVWPIFGQILQGK